MNPGASPNLILTGFMGTGKTLVGHEVARRLGRRFVDMDVEIEARADKSVYHIFAQNGEEAFRRMEAALCRELSAQTGLVIATGGGAMVDPANRAVMMQGGSVVCLTCDRDEILRRVSEGDEYRPLLQVADPRAEIERLLAARHEAYATIPWQVDTTALSPDQVAERVIQFADVVTLPVHYPDGEYPIHIGAGLLAHVGGALRAAGMPEGSRIAVVSNPVVAPLYGRQVEAALRSAGFLPFACSIPDGESHKTLTTVAALYDQFLAAGHTTPRRTAPRRTVRGLDRSGTVLSLGGGVTGDIAGFAAASFMRGVRFVQVPTTILAMADASVGGKVGVDLPQGKNLVGAFKQPVAVVMDPTVLATLPEEEVRSGMAEVIKHSIIGAPDLLAELEVVTPNAQSISTSLLAQSLQVKIQVIENDPYEQGRRAVLNLGHTVGHGLERLSDFSLRHGEAVAIGMVAASRIALELGRADRSLSDRIEAVLEAWGLPVRCPPYDADAIWEAMTHDKKRRGRTLRWVLPHAIGHVEIVEDVPLGVVKSVLQDLGARGSHAAGVGNDQA
jgi:shikimate kinase/3-dehydroquinate synthase